MSQICPCGSDKNLENCCLPIIKNEQKPQTAEQLMRARYSAYTLHDVDFVEKTHHKNGQDQFNKQEALDWAKSANWQKLEILNTEDGNNDDSSGYVEFKAHYQINGADYIHHERSQFEKENDDWRFLHGEIINQPLRREGKKVGRNEPCPCGSGKKYKKCCAA